jgi:hypothetical protein
MRVFVFVVGKIGFSCAKSRYRKLLEIWWSLEGFLYEVYGKKICKQVIFGNSGWI